jgi:hypothetical protein
MGSAQATAKHREILGEYIYHPAIDGTIARHHAITQWLLFTQSELFRAMGNKGIDFSKRSVIQKNLYPLAGS